MKKIYLIIGAIFFLSCGVLFGYEIGLQYEKGVLVTALNVIHPLRENDSSYQFINPLLAYIIPDSEQDNNFKLFSNKIEDFINTEQQTGELLNAAVFLSELNQGKWIGINEDEKYPPASMMKVVIAVAYLKRSEDYPSTLEKRLTYTASLSQLLKQNSLNAESNLKVQESYRVEDLMNAMLVYSDNGAEFLLLDNIEDSYLNSIYHVLNIDNPEISGNNFTISPRSYSLFFRILYSATYLSKENSEKALAILSRTTFNDGIVAGVPKSTPVAHKFGQHVTTQNGVIQDIELHDCGIVYNPNTPYLICIMTKGNSIEELKKTIKSISQLAYENIK